MEVSMSSMSIAHMCMCMCMCMCMDKLCMREVCLLCHCANTLVSPQVAGMAVPDEIKNQSTAQLTTEDLKRMRATMAAKMEGEASVQQQSAPEEVASTTTSISQVPPKGDSSNPGSGGHPVARVSATCGVFI